MLQAAPACPASPAPRPLHGWRRGYKKDGGKAGKAWQQHHPCLPKMAWLMSRQKVRVPVLLLVVCLFVCCFLGETGWGSMHYTVTQKACCLLAMHTCHATHIHIHIHTCHTAMPWEGRERSQQAKLEKARESKWKFEGRSRSV